MDPATIAVSVAASLLGSGALATLIAKAFDARAAKDADKRADAAADGAFERNLKGVKAAQALDRRKAQALTVDRMMGAAIYMTDAAHLYPWAGMPAIKTDVSSTDEGQLTDTEEGRAVVAAFANLRVIYRGDQSKANWTVDLDDLDRMVGVLGEAAKAWRALSP